MAGLPALLDIMLQDALAVARAELALVKARIRERVRRSVVGIALLAVALLIVQAGLGGLALGFVLALVPHVGAAGAGALVFVGALVIAGLLALIGARQFSAPRAAASTEVSP